MSEPTKDGVAANVSEPSVIVAFDSGEWRWYVRSHDEAALDQIDALDALMWEKLWMRAIPASAAEDFGVPDDDSDDHVLRNPATGRFEARVCWVECPETANGAEPWMGVRYVR